MPEGMSEPFLERVYREDCAGCRVDRWKESRRGMPLREFLYVWLVTLCTALPISSLFPFVYFMVRDLNIADSEEDIGYYAGYIGSSFMFGRTLTSFFWGIIADKYGRKPVIVFGICSVIIFNTLFGLSINFWMAVSTRFLLGALNGLLSPIKAYAVEISPLEYQATALSLLEILPMYPPQHTYKTGQVLAVSGFSVLLFQLFLFPHLIRLLGPVVSSRIAGVLAIFLLSIYPTFSNLSGLGLSTVINVASLLKNILSMIANTGLSILQNNSVDQCQRGAANGISMTLMSLSKTAAPATGGALFSWAQKRQSASFLPGDQAVFFALMLVEFLGVLVTFRPFLVTSS